MLYCDHTPMSLCPAAPNFFKPLTVALLAASVGCLLMLALRVLVTGSFRYGLLPWNLFLAWMPYLLSLVIFRIGSKAEPARKLKLAGGAVGLLWLVFYPNAPYILTDFIHVIHGPVEPPSQNPAITANTLLWYDILLSSVFAFVGHILGLISLIILNDSIRRQYSKRIAWLVVGGATVLGGFGIYLGRFRGLNSWDVFSDTVTTFKTAFLDLLNLKAVLFSLAFAFFIFLTYLVVWSLYDTARRR